MHVVNLNEPGVASGAMGHSSVTYRLTTSLEPDVQSPTRRRHVVSHGQEEGKSNV